MLTDGVLLRLAKSDFIKYVKSPLERRLGYDEASELVGRGSVWLDVRPRAAYKRAHIQGAKSIPFEQLRQQLSDLDPEVLYVVYCDDGHASATAAYLMLEFGLQATVLDGGLQRLDDGLLASSERENVVALGVGGASGRCWPGCNSSCYTASGRSRPRRSRFSTSSRPWKRPRECCVMRNVAMPNSLMRRMD
ncbi:MAG: rhodanese-like domain-containing protein [gamma proteobacterium symbiont of Phacoides pectinatus]